MTGDVIPAIGVPVPDALQVEKWWHKVVGPMYGCLPQHVQLAQSAACWAADEQLEVICQWLDDHHGDSDALRKHCRPGEEGNPWVEAVAALDRLAKRNNHPLQEAEDLVFLQNFLEGLQNG